MGLWPQKWWPKSSLGSSAVWEGNLALGTWVRVEGGGAWGLWRHVGESGGWRGVGALEAGWGFVGQLLD